MIVADMTALWLINVFTIRTLGRKERREREACALTAWTKDIRTISAPRNATKRIWYVNTLLRGQEI